MSESPPWFAIRGWGRGERSGKVPTAAPKLKQEEGRKVLSPSLIFLFDLTKRLSVIKVIGQ